MFDIGFSELVLVFIIGLIVLGPQRLLVAVQNVMGWLREIRSLASNAHHELVQELKLQELQDSLKKMEEASRNTLSPTLQESMEVLRNTADLMKRSVSVSQKIEEECEEHTIHSPLQQAADRLLPSVTSAGSKSQIQATIETLDKTASSEHISAFIKNPVFVDVQIKKSEILEAAELPSPPLLEREE